MSSPRAIPQRGADAYSLVEVIIAIVLIAFILAPTFAVLKIGNRLATSARLETLASQIITTQVENLRSQTYSSIKSEYLDKPQPVDITNLATEGFTDLPTNFTVQAAFTVLEPFGDGNPPYGKAEALITVSYVDAFGKTKTPSTYVRLSERGLSDYVFAGF
ncbi:MAG: hypothetical protein NVV63_14175 [Opitutus sp.]|nr:hypothetical protein [Opitutus sp.]